MAAFEVLKPGPVLSPRLGSLSIPGKSAIPTPHYIANTSRGVVLHLSQDNLEKHTNINGLYLGLEDFIEKAPQETPPVFSTPCEKRQDSPLRRFIAVRDEQLLVLGPRRVPALDSPGSNTNAGIQIHTSVGHRALSSEYYASAATKLRPDVVVGLADVMPGHPNPSLKRVEKMGDRTARWMKDLVGAVSQHASRNGSNTNGDGHADANGVDAPSSSSHSPAVFAPILPIEPEQQSYYLSDLTSSPLFPQLSGLALYSPSSIDSIPAKLSHLPRLSLSDPPTPAKLLHEIAQGVDLFTLPLADAATDAGMALLFSFPAPAHPPTSPCASSPPRKLPLALDAWSPTHATTLTPPSPCCPTPTCYTCRTHSLAYLTHLLSAKEMLAWVLLSIHNHHVLAHFFAGVRRVLAAPGGSALFEEERRRFDSVYDGELPSRTGAGPRVRGHMVRSRGVGEGRRNARGFAGLGLGLGLG
ncbi:tRNA-guanine transglycosylase family protein [Phyllosticta citrichinensis]|uniref:Queuine tRNA-ribosyltransferase accessory subunit 2 n=1 Tax=Phyllosticta citrichinensis TaxID=1130410 RepID=A0ABR1XYH4_9PEZI